MIKKILNKIKSQFIKEDHSPLRKGKNGNFIFIHINKTGGTSVAKAVGMPGKRHLHVTEVISIIGEKDFNDAYVFTVVRNPWDKVVSHYKYRVKTNQTDLAKNPISFKNGSNNLTEIKTLNITISQECLQLNPIGLKMIRELYV